jgi:hypothetical protein
MVPALSVVALAATPATAAGGTHPASPPPVTVKPGSGGTKTRFVVSFRAPERTGLVGTTWRRYQVNATGPARSNCVWDPFAQAPPSRKGARVKLVLDPAKLGGVVVRTVGRFKFHVKASSSDPTPA